MNDETTNSFQEMNDEKLLEKQKIEKSSELYQECIQGTKDSPEEKKLFNQIASTFFKQFPHFRGQAKGFFIRGIEALQTLSEKHKQVVIYTANSLAQLSRLDEQNYDVACNPLVQAIQIDLLNANKWIFNNLRVMDDKPPQDKTVKILLPKVIELLGSDETHEINDILLKRTMKMIRYCCLEEFILMMYLLEPKCVDGQEQMRIEQDIINLIAKKIELNRIFSPNDIDRLIVCMDLVMPLFNFNNHSSKFVAYYCQQVLPKLTEIVTLQNGEQLQIELLRHLALMSTHCNHITQEHLNNLLECLKQFIQLPPEDVDLFRSPDLKFCHVECLLYSFHKLSKMLPEFLLNCQQKLNEFRTTLQYFLCGVLGCKQGLNMATHGNLRNKLLREDLPKVYLTPQVLNNLLVIIKDLLHQTPLYTANVQLSFTMTESTAKIREKSTLLPTRLPTKRFNQTPIDSANGNSKRPREEVASSSDSDLSSASGKWQVSWK